MGILFPRSSSSADRLWNNPAVWDTGGVMRRTSSGQDVTPSSAMTVATYFACVAGIAEDIAGLPSSVIAAGGPGSGYRAPLRDHPVTALLSDEANPEMAGFTFVETMQAWCDGWGNAYAEIQRNGGGQIVALWPMHPSRVTVKRDESERLYYWVRASDVGAKEPWIRMEPRDVFHLRGLGDDVEGYSVLKFRAESIGLAIAAQTFAGSMFQRDLSQRLMFTPAAAMDTQTFTALMTNLKEKYAGAEKAGGVLGANVVGKFERVSVNPDEAQALETRQFSVPDICRWFRRSPSKVGYTQQAKGWAMREDEQADDVQQCLMPRVLRWEHEVRRKLLGFSTGLGFKFFLDGLLRANSEKRAAYYAIRIANASMTPNEVRSLEDQPPSDDPNADKLLVNGSLHLLESLDAAPDPAPPATFPGAPVEDPADPEDPMDPAEPTDAPKGIDLLDRLANVRRNLDGVPVGSPAFEAAADLDRILDVLDRHTTTTPEAAAETPAAAAPSRPDLSALDPVFAHAAARVIRRESAALARVMAKQDAAFDGWAEKFYAAQRSMVGEEFGPPVAALATLAGWDAPAASAALATFAAALWPDPTGRTAEAYRTPEDALASSLSSAVRAAVTPKE